MKTRKYCPHCGRELTKSQTKGYTYQCTYCDEDFYKIEALNKNDLLLKNKSGLSELFSKRLKGVSALFNHRELRLTVNFGKKKLLDVDFEDIYEAEDYWNSFHHKKLIYDINLYIPEETEKGVYLTAYAVINNHIDTNISIKIPLRIIL